MINTVLPDYPQFVGGPHNLSLVPKLHKHIWVTVICGSIYRRVDVLFPTGGVTRDGSAKTKRKDYWVHDGDFTFDEYGYCAGAVEQLKKRGLL